MDGKGHAMVMNETETRTIMAFWAKHLKAAPPESGPDSTLLEVMHSDVQHS